MEKCTFCGELATVTVKETKIILCGIPHENGGLCHGYRPDELEPLEDILLEKIKKPETY